MTEVVPSAPRRRPRDRKQQILTAAAGQFWSRGYHQVGMADIAGTVDIAASALYRHHRSKQDLLVAILHEALDQLAPSEPGAEHLDHLVARLAARGLSRREFGALWDRERGHLPDADREALTQRLHELVERTTTAIVRHRADGTTTAALRARAVIAVLESPSYSRVELDRNAFQDLLQRAARAVVDVELGSPGPVVRLGPGRAPQVPTSRREALLWEAVGLFAARGFAVVSLTDIGAASGMAGPSVYHWFPSKNDLLMSALGRGTEALWLGLHHALAGADDPLDALHRTLDSYTAFAAVNPDIVSVMLTGAVHLPEARRDQVRRAQQEYVDEWVALLRRSRPELDDPQARVLVHATLALPNSLVRVRGLRARPGLTTEVAAMGRAVLQVPLSPESHPRRPTLAR